MGGTTAEADLEAVEIHEVLSNERRQLILEFLRQDSEVLSARELSEKIAEVETGESPPPTNIRQSAYVFLHQTHLPKLDKLGVIDYDQSAKIVELNDRARQISVYMETVPKYGLTWREYYLALAVIGLLAVVAGELGVPVFARIGSLTVATAAFAIIIVAAVYQTVSRQSSLFHRLGD